MADPCARNHLDDRPLTDTELALAQGILRDPMTGELR